jgi:hypothetical protein
MLYKVFVNGVLKETTQSANRAFDLWKRLVDFTGPETRVKLCYEII